MRWLFTMLGGVRAGALALAVLVVLYLATTVVPAGHIGVQDFFGRVSDRLQAPGINLIVPGTRVVKFSVQTREMKETAAVPTSEGLIVNLDVSCCSGCGRRRPGTSTRPWAAASRAWSSIPSCAP